jgi:hypothetical protein
MSLRKKPTITEERIAASQAKGRRSRGPATREGRERIRDAATRHGLYSHAEGVALRALGEKPEEFEAMVNAVMEKWPPANGFEELLDRCLARAFWGMERAHRMQEGYALRQAKDVNLGREDRLHAQMMRLKMTSASLQSLAQSVARPYYLTTPHDLGIMKSLLQEGVVKEMGEIALALFLQLQPPDKGEEEVDTYEQSRRALQRIKEIFGLAGDHPPLPPGARGAGQPPDSSPAPSQNPGGVQVAPEPVVASPVKAEVAGPPSCFTTAEWKAREPVRQLLEHILTRQVEICEAQRTATLKESLAGPTPYERAAEIAPTHPHARLMRRMQDSNFREIWRMTNLLLKVKRQAREEETLEDPARSLNVDENSAA